MTKRQKIDVALPEELLNSFAKALVPEIRAFYDSDVGTKALAKELSSSSGSATSIFGRLVIGSPPYKLRSF